MDVVVVTTLDQRLRDVKNQPAATVQLKPLRKQLLIKKSVRCKVRELILGRSFVIHYWCVSRRETLYSALALYSSSSIMSFSSRFIISTVIVSKLLLLDQQSRWLICVKPHLCNCNFQLEVKKVILLIFLIRNSTMIYFMFMILLLEM